MLVWKFKHEAKYGQLAMDACFARLSRTFCSNFASNHKLTVTDSNKLLTFSYIFFYTTNIHILHASFIVNYKCNIRSSAAKKVQSLNKLALKFL